MFENGYYWLFDDQNQRYVSYCDLSSEPGAAWTLVVSWNKASKNLSFSKQEISTGRTSQPQNPNWNVYRQTMARMKSLCSRSTHWRATCSFNLMKAIDYRDYIRGSFSDFDIMTFLGKGKCFKVEYVNIRGHAAGSGTTEHFWLLRNSNFLRIDSGASGCAASLMVAPFQVKTTLGFMVLLIATSCALRVTLRRPSGGSVATWLRPRPR